MGLHVYRSEDIHSSRRLHPHVHPDAEALERLPLLVEQVAQGRSPVRAHSRVHCCGRHHMLPLAARAGFASVPLHWRHHCEHLPFRLRRRLRDLRGDDSPPEAHGLCHAAEGNRRDPREQHVDQEPGRSQQALLPCSGAHPAEAWPVRGQGRHPVRRPGLANFGSVWVVALLPGADGAGDAPHHRLHRPVHALRGLLHEEEPGPGLLERSELDASAVRRHELGLRGERRLGGAGRAGCVPLGGHEAAREVHRHGLVGLPCSSDISELRRQVE
mmetsp:Transcript_113807/g.363120  ORF Transcript_113807/g.363120 Transcript_113807/m.363120 type:complete len:272 (-) Transcript_113807:523-1338(-)